MKEKPIELANQTDSSKRNAKISNHAYKNSVKTQIIFIDNLIINPHSLDLEKHTAKEYYIRQNSKNIEENIVLKIKERQEAI